MKQKNNRILGWVLLLALLNSARLVLAADGDTFTPSPFTIPQGAYTAEFVQDIDHITVMKFSGNYDRNLPGGEPNAAARAVGITFPTNLKDSYPDPDLFLPSATS